MDYLEIKYAVNRKGYTWRRIARELGLHSAPCVSMVVERRYRSARVEEKIAEITGLPLAKLFPDRYGKGKKQEAA